MALSTIISLGSLWNRLTINEMELWLPSAVEGSDETGGGDLIEIANGRRMWEGYVRVMSDDHAIIDGVWATFQYALTAGVSFTLCPVHRVGPVNDPTLSKLGAATPTLSAVAANQRDITISGLPPNYNGLRIGTYLSLAKANSRIAFHQIAVMTTLNADASGVLAGIEVIPPLAPGYAIGQEVVLASPLMRAKVIKDSVKPPRLMAGVSKGFTFGFRQSLA